jgi:hypothetical protein
VWCEALFDARVLKGGDDESTRVESAFENRRAAPSGMAPSTDSTRVIPSTAQNLQIPSETSACNPLLAQRVRHFFP